MNARLEAMTAPRALNVPTLRAALLAVVLLASRLVQPMKTVTPKSVKTSMNALLESLIVR